MAPTISYDIAATVNLGNFENVRVGFGLEDVIREGETKEEAVARIAEFVERNWQDRVQVAVDKFRESAG